MADYTRIYSGDDGLSHFEDLDFKYEDLAGVQTPVAPGVSAASASPGNVKGAVFRRFSLGNSSKHTAPRKQYAVVLTGSPHPANFRLYQNGFSNLAKLLISVCIQLDN